jgi:acyl-CoA hydrolase
MKLKTHITAHLVKGDDLNHRGTLFAGKTAMWFVEAGFIAAASITNPESIVLMNIHGMLFGKPIHNGSVIRFESNVVLAGNTSLVSYVKVVDNSNENFLLDGFITFIHVDKNARHIPHGIVINPTDPEDMALQEKAKNLQIVKK